MTGCALVCGSFAYDNIMVFEGRFADEILPDKVHMLNVSFLVPALRREFGGCAGNIAYNLHALGERVLPMGTVGEDFAPYRARLDALGVPQTHILEVPGSYTAQAYITTDLDDNQITAFHPGAMNSAHVQSVPDSGIAIGMVSPDGRDGMIRHAREFAERDIPFVFDPGQGLPMFDGAELLTFVEQARWVTVNDYECSLLQARCGLDERALAQRVEALIVTRGAQGSRIHHAGTTLEIPAVKPDAVVDPTGCGDAYRAGLLYGLMQGWDWQLTGQLASLLGAIKIAHPGTQNHGADHDGVFGRYRELFGVDPR